MDSPAESVPLKSLAADAVDKADTSLVSLPRAARTHWRWAAPVLLVVLVFVAFVPALTAGIVNWDDDDLLWNETRYRTLTPANLKWMFTTTFAGHYQPLTWLSYTLDWHLWGREMFGFHLTNVLLHAGSAVVFYFIMRRLILYAVQRAPLAARPLVLTLDPSCRVLILSSAAAAAIFAVHPLRVESVAWLAERRDVLSAFFFLLCVLFYLRYTAARMFPLGHSVDPEMFRRTQHDLNGPTSASATVNYVAALLCCALSLLAKASGVTLPIVLLILDLYLYRRLDRTNEARPEDPLVRHGGSQIHTRRTEKRQAIRFLVEKLPFAALCIPAAILAYFAQREQGAMYPLSEYPLEYRAAQALYGLTFYVAKTLWPSNLGPLYQIPAGDELLGPLLWQGIAGTAALVAGALVFWRIAPAITAAIIYYIVQVFPVLGFAQSGPQLVADRYSYLPTLGFAALLGAGVYRLAARISARRDKDLLRLLSLAAVAVIIALSHTTFRQSDVWLSSLTLWSRGVQVSPNSSIAHTNFGDALAENRAPAAALHEYKTALSLNPKDPIAVRNLAKLLLLYGDNLRAAAFYEYAVTLTPAFAPMYPDYATALERAGRPGTAIDVLRERIAAAPDDMACTAYLAHLLSTHPDDDLRNGAEAVELALRVNDRPAGPDARSLLLLATAFAEAQRFDDAVAAAEEALRMAQSAGDEPRVGEIARRLELFRKNEPYRSGR